MGAEFFQADGQTDGHDEGNSRFSQFCDAPKNERDDWSLRFIWLSYNNTRATERIRMLVDTAELQH